MLEIKTSLVGPKIKNEKKSIMSKNLTTKFCNFTLITRPSASRVARASASGAESGQTNDFKAAWRLLLKGHCGEQAGKFTFCAVGKGT